MVKITKKWANLVYLVYFLNFSTDFKIWENVKANFPYIIVMIMPFPGFERLSVAKNKNATFFRVGGSIIFVFYYEIIFFYEYCQS